MLFPVFLFFFWGGGGGGGMRKTAHPCPRPATVMINKYKHIRILCNGKSYGEKFEFAPDQSNKFLIEGTFLSTSKKSTFVCHTSPYIEKMFVLFNFRPYQKEIICLHITLFHNTQHFLCQGNLAGNFNV